VLALKWIPKYSKSKKGVVTCEMLW